MATTCCKACWGMYSLPGSHGPLGSAARWETKRGSLVEGQPPRPSLMECESGGLGMGEAGETRKSRCELERGVWRDPSLWFPL